MQHLHYETWLEWFRLRNAKPEDEFSMDGCVPEETQQRWTDKHNAARFRYKSV